MKNKVVCPTCKDSILSRLYLREVDGGSQTFKGTFWLCKPCKLVYYDDLSLLSSSPTPAAKIVDYAEKTKIVDYPANDLTPPTLQTPVNPEKVPDHRPIIYKDMDRKNIVDYKEYNGEKVIATVTKKDGEYLMLESGKLVPVPIPLTTPH